MTGNTIIAHSRRLLADSDVGIERWPTATLLLYLNHSLRTLYRQRPDLSLQDNGTISEDGPLTTGAEAMVLDVKFEEPLALCVASSALREDSNDAANIEMAEMYEQKFLQRIMV